jgi:hypothetical protein
MAYAQGQWQYAQEPKQVQKTCPQKAIFFDWINSVAFEVDFPNAYATATQFEQNEKCEKTQTMQHMISSRISAHHLKIDNFF